MTDWQPIETYPKDRPRVLLWGNGAVRFGYLDERGNWRKLHHGHMHGKPTHWMPIPEPPKQEAA